MNKTLPLPLFEMPGGCVVDMRYIWAVERISNEYPGKARFVVHYKNTYDTYFGEEPWLSLQRDELIEGWGKVKRD